MTDLASFLESQKDVVRHSGVKGMKWGVRKDLIGINNLGAGGGGGTVATPGSKAPSTKESSRVSAGTLHVRRALTDKTTGPARPGGEMDALNEKFKAAKLDPMDPNVKPRYDSQMSKLLTLHAQKAAPKGATARVEIRGDGVMLLVGDAKTVNRFVDEVLSHAEFEGLDKMSLRVIRDEDGFIIDFTDDLEHVMDYVDYLAHYGVQGMKWGVRKGELTNPGAGRGGTDAVIDKGTRNAIKARVKSGTGTLEDAHLAALKSRGHRTLNVLLGDKTYWKNQAGILGAALAIGLTTVVAPGLLPAAAIAAASVGLQGLDAAAVIRNTLRGFRGNSTINKSLATLGDEAKRLQNEGSKRVQSTLKIAGGIPGRRLKHAEEDISGTIQDFYNKLSPADRDTVDLIIGAAMDGTDLSGEPQILDSYYALSDISRGLIDFVVGAAVDKGATLAQNEDLDNFLAHYGVRGMKWGVRRSDEQLGNTKTVKAKMKTHPDGSVEVKGTQKRPVGSEIQIDKHDGSGAQTYVKRADGNWTKSTPKTPSDDAARAIDALKKDPIEMSNKEIQDAVARARLVSDYDRFFGANTSPQNPGPNAELEAYVRRLELQKKMKDLRPPPPEKKSAITKLVAGATMGYGAFRALDKATDGQLSKGIGEKVGIKLGTKSAGPTLKDRVDTAKLTKELHDIESSMLPKAPKVKSAIDILAENNKELGARIDNLSLTKKLEGLLEPDAPSLAEGYKYAGKRRKQTNRVI